MATREGNVGEGLEGLERFDALSQEIEEKFSHFHSLLETQRVSLLERVRKMRDLYQEHQELSQAIEELETVRKAANETLKANLIVKRKENLVKVWEDEIAELMQNKSKLEMVYNLKLVVNTEEVNDCVNRIHLREIEAEEYSKRREPLVMKGKMEHCENEFLTLPAMSIDDRSKEVFIQQFMKDIVCVYSFEGDFIRKIQHAGFIVSYGICQFDEFLYLSCVSDSNISKFTKTGDFVKKTSLEGENAIQLKTPSGLCVHNELLYVCNLNNNRIEVLNLELVFVANFGEDKLQSPEDIKIFNNEVFVLTQFDNAIHTFSTKHNYLRSIHFTGQQNQISQTFFFTIDNNGNFIVSDYTAGCLKVFSPSGEYIETLGERYLVLPGGVAVDNQGRILVVNRSDYNYLQVY